MAQAAEASGYSYRHAWRLLRQTPAVVAALTRSPARRRPMKRRARTF